MKGKKNKKGQGKGKRAKVEKHYDSKTFESDSARARARELMNKSKWGK